MYGGRVTNIGGKRCWRCLLSAFRLNPILLYRRLSLSNIRSLSVRVEYCIYNRIVCLSSIRYTVYPLTRYFFVKYTKAFFFGVDEYLQFSSAVAVAFAVANIKSFSIILCLQFLVYVVYVVWRKTNFFFLSFVHSEKFLCSVWLFSFYSAWALDVKLMRFYVSFSLFL